jgi:GNAT superfamily N-acetyltransferase
VTADPAPLVTYRTGSLADSRTVFEVFLEAAQDLAQRHGLGWHYDTSTPEAIEKQWSERRSLFEHMATHAESFWIAEEDGRAVGYARTFRRSGLRELTEFFVRPSVQAKGIGRELLARAFPAEGAARRVIIATMDTRALTRYLRTGLRPRFVQFFFDRKAEPRRVATDLAIEPLPAVLDPATLAALGAIDLELLDVRRDQDHAWLATEKQGFVARRAGRVVGYGYAGVRSGPFAALDPADQPALFAHAESLVAPLGIEFGVSLATINLVGLEYVLAHGFRLDAFAAHFLSDAPFGRFDRYSFTTPSLFL